MPKSKWSVDPAHSNIDFSVRHMMIAKVKGAFETFTAEVDADPEDLTTAGIRFTIDAASINTREKDRDAHLRSADFFDAEKFPNITFQSRSIAKKAEGEYEVTGDLTIRDVTRSETFTVTYEGTGKDPWGNERVGFSGNGSVNRSDFGLTWNAVLETGGVLVGDEIKISFEIQATRQN
ncbi:YceI family protein [Ferviditalea candida]|uniref:YceI family protein n=1 Tax=Ferviditalea candida TaxID=3108399 RepID=A0ABU5ZC30_9BACL|nr:YceI family protein [Paenibacillaceae bacterium T2]